MAYVLDVILGRGGTDKVKAQTIGTLINGSTAKTTPVDADNVPISDSAASYGLKKTTWAQIKTTLKTYFDTLYEAAGALSGHLSAFAHGDIATNSSHRTTVTGNPHAVTKTDVGLGNVTNNAQVIAPATNTDLLVPQWDGVNSKTLKDGLGVGTGTSNLVQRGGEGNGIAVDRINAISTYYVNNCAGAEGTYRRGDTYEYIVVNIGTGFWEVGTGGDKYVYRLTTNPTYVLGWNNVDKWSIVGTGTATTFDEITDASTTPPAGPYDGGAEVDVCCVFAHDQVNIQRIRLGGPPEYNLDAATKAYADAKVASVSGTAPIASSGGTTPAISISAASAGAAGSMSAAHYATVNAISAYGTVYVDAGAMVPATTAGATAANIETTTYKHYYDVMDFAGGADDKHINFKLRMPEDWNGGTIKVKAVWEPETGASADDWVRLDVQAVALGNDDAIDAAFGDPVYLDDQVIAVGDLHITAASAAMTVAGTPAAGDVVHFLVGRDADYDGGGTAMAEKLRLHSLEIQYTKSTTAAPGW